MEQAIGVFDSGIGGLTVANAILECLPAESILYFADTAHIPYGQKSPATIRRYSYQICAWLLEGGCKAIVVACNTASAAALNQLRARFPGVIIVGMEPAVKPAAEATRSGVVGVLATAGTFKSQRYTQLMQRYAGNIRVLQDPCLGLVEKIESGLAGDPGTRAMLAGILAPMVAAGADTFVLGCTHYPFVRPLIEQLTGPDAVIIDPAPAVARQLARRLKESALLSASGQEPTYCFHASGPDTSLHNTLRQYWRASFFIS